MRSERFYLFIQLIDGLHKSISRLKADFSPHFGVKSVHIFWLYELRDHPEGLTSTELAEHSRISRSLVSRELESLRLQGYVELRETPRGRRKNYSSPIFLTEKGQLLADSIAAEAQRVQDLADEGITEAEMAAFYQTLTRLYRNLAKLSGNGEGREDNDPLPDSAALFLENTKKD